MSKRQTIPQEEVLRWLRENHPDLEAEVDRAWVWLVCDLRDKPEVRQSLKQYGFVFAKRGGHALPSGKIGTWGHSCNAPIPFRRRFERRAPAQAARPAAPRSSPRTQDRLDPLEENHSVSAEVLAFVGLAG